MANQDRIVRDLQGDLFIETSDAWLLPCLETHRKDPSQPFPMPRGHLMFARPEEYHCVRVAPESIHG